MREDFLRTFNEELALLVTRWLEERSSNGACFRSSYQFLRWPPIRTPTVQRVEHNVAALFIVEALDELAGRVIEDGGVTARLDLPQHLHDDRGLPAARVPDDLEVLIFSPDRNAEHLPAAIRLDAD